MTADNLTDAQKQIVAMIRDFVQREVTPVATEMERADEYPEAIGAGLRELGRPGGITPGRSGRLGGGGRLRAAWANSTYRQLVSCAPVANVTGSPTIVVRGRDDRLPRRG